MSDTSIATFDLAVSPGPNLATLTQHQEYARKFVEAQNKARKCLEDVRVSVQAEWRTDKTLEARIEAAKKNVNNAASNDGTTCNIEAITVDHHSNLKITIVSAVDAVSIQKVVTLIGPDPYTALMANILNSLAIDVINFTIAGKIGAAFQVFNESLGLFNCQLGQVTGIHDENIWNNALLNVKVRLENLGRPAVEYSEIVYVRKRLGVPAGQFELSKHFSIEEPCYEIEINQL